MKTANTNFLSFFTLLLCANVLSLLRVARNPSQTDCGVVYIATGDACYAEALKSAKSLRAQTPSIRIALFTDARSVDGIFDVHTIIEQPDYSTLDKVKNLWRTPFAKTLFLDSDTYVAEDIAPLFDLLDKVDIAGTHEVARGFWYTHLDDKVPKPFCEVNGGMILFRARPEVIGLFKDWYETYLETKSWLPEYGSSKWMLTNDQPSLRYLLWTRPNINLWILPTEYNAIRINGLYLWGTAKIVHGRGNIEDVAQRMNKNPNVERAFFQGFGVILDFSRANLWQVLKTSLRINYFAAAELFGRASRLLTKGINGQGRS